MSDERKTYEANDPAVQELLNSEWFTAIWKRADEIVMSWLIAGKSEVTFFDAMEKASEEILGRPLMDQQDYVEAFEEFKRNGTAQPEDSVAQAADAPSDPSSTA